MGIGQEAFQLLALYHHVPSVAIAVLISRSGFHP
jgi:hypothetical protein